MKSAKPECPNGSQWTGTGPALEIPSLPVFWPAKESQQSLLAKSCLELSPSDAPSSSVTELSLILAGLDTGHENKQPPVRNSPLLHSMGPNRTTAEHHRVALFLVSRVPTACPCLLQGLVLTRSCHGEKMLDSNNVGLREAVQQNKDPVLREFLRLLALCHTVMVEERGGGLGSPVRGFPSRHRGRDILDMNCLGWGFLLDRDWEWHWDPIGNGGGIPLGSVWGSYGECCWDPVGSGAGVPWGEVVLA